MYKKAEYKAFIKAIGEGQVAHWVEMARLLEVDEDTITNWKKLPEAQEAIQKGINHALECMQQAGARDWRMWEAKLKMLGVNPPQKVEAKHELDDPVKRILEKFDLGGTDNVGEAEGSKSASSKSST